MAPKFMFTLPMLSLSIEGYKRQLPKRRGSKKQEAHIHMQLKRWSSLQEDADYDERLTLFQARGTIVNGS